MRTLFAILWLLYTCNNAYTQGKGGIEQYTYLGTGERPQVAPVIHYQDNNKWYAEARYNYEDRRTFSLYAGKTFSSEKKVAWALTPMIGGMTGKQQGGLLGLNTTISYKKTYFSSQSQYGVSQQGREENFFFSWSEAGYQLLPWMCTGISLQHTKLYNCRAVVEPGLFAGFSFKQWTFPVYSFNPFGAERYFVLGINREWKFGKSKRHRAPAFSQAATSPIVDP